ncbi:MAG: DNA-binding GntR family transcriptional regulator [Paracoccaceae bacterium]
MAQAVTKSKSNVNRVYEDLRQMAANFEFMPDARINEGELAASLNTSRTPVREALNRLVAEGFLTFQSGRGFFCRSLSPSLILDLYEARVAIECEALRLACERADDDQIGDLKSYLTVIEPRYLSCADPIELLALDEDFHNKLTALSGNKELATILTNLNDRIRYVRLINLKSLQDKPVNSQMSAHRVIVNALVARDANAAVAAMRSHIEQRRSEATEAVRIAYSQLYVPAD